MVIQIQCPSCPASFPVDPDKIPEAGVKARCSSCGQVFRVERPLSIDELAPDATSEVVTEPEPEVVPEAEPAPEPEPDVAAESEPEFPVEPEEEITADFSTEAPAEPDLSVEAEDDDAAHEAPATSSFFSAGAPAAAEETSAQESVWQDAGTPAVEDAAAAIEDATPAVEDAAVEEAPAEEAAPKAGGFSFGKRDPKDKAKRLARVLVSDMTMYNADLHESALAKGTLKEDFEEEIDKSWKEYVEQVGAEMAEGDGQEFWRQALNDVLAKGEQLF